MSTARPRVVVVGAGIVGLCVAEALVRDGCAVSVVERGSHERDGASFGNAGLIVPSHVVPLAAPGVLGQGVRWLLDPESPFTIRARLDLDLVRWGVTFARSATARHVARSAPLLRDLHLRSKALHLDLAERLAPAPPAPRCAGALVVCRTEHAWAEEVALARRAAELGLRADVLDAAGVAERVAGPEVRCVGGVHYLDDAHASPRALMRALQDHLVAVGVTFHWDADVVGFERHGGRVVGARLRDGDVVAGERFVLAGGVASARLARVLGAYVPMQAGRGYSVTVPDVGVPPALPLLLAEARVAVTPLPEGVRVGGTMEIADPARPVDPRRVRGIARSAERYLPGFAADRLATLPVWTGARPVSADGMPYLGPLRRAPEVVVAAGHGMMGFSLAPVTGALVADLIAGRAFDPDLTALAPERFGGARGR